MFEMLITVVVTVAAFVYGISHSVLMDSPNRHYYWAGIFGVVILILILSAIIRSVRRRHLNRLHVNEQDYIYYHKYNSILYRIGYFISYLVQNILFDYTYMRRNFNFCKGLNTYDDGVSEYYIKFRNTWYQYLRLLHLRHRLSMCKLKSFSCRMKNQLIADQFQAEEEKARYQAFDQATENYVNEHGTMDLTCINRIEGHEAIDSYYRKNTALFWKYYLKAGKISPKILSLVERQQKHGRLDIEDYKKSGLR